MDFETTSYLNEKGILAKNCKQQLSDETLLKAYRIMRMFNYVDERMITLQRQGTISFAMSGFGEEAAVVGSVAALDFEDWIFPQYRENAVMYWRGYTIEEYLHHMFCNAKDNLLGRQMPNHFGSKDLNVVTVSSPLATQIPQAAGCAYAMKVKKEKKVALCYFGEGTSSKEDFVVGLNMAAVTKAPAIFFCRNNHYAISTHHSRQFVTDGVCPKAAGQGVRSFRVDGNDFFAVHEVTSKARALCLEGKGPIFIEAMTYRLGAHSTSDDPSAYREDDELAKYQKFCPIKRFYLYLESKKLWSKEKDESLTQELKEEVDKAIQAAKETGPPSLRSLVEDVYFSVPEHLEEQYEQLKKFFPSKS